MEPKFVEKGPIRLIGIVKTGKLDDIVPNLNDIWMNQFMNYEPQVKPFSIDQAYYGAWIGHPDGSCTYVAGMAVAEMAEIPGGLAERVLPAAQYVVFDCTVKTIGQTYDEVYGRWLPASTYEYDLMANDFEFYPADTETNESPAQVYVPVRLKQPEAAG
jgi:AraC family transcriptional regulator